MDPTSRAIVLTAAEISGQSESLTYPSQARLSNPFGSVSQSIAPPEDPEA